MLDGEMKTTGQEREAVGHTVPFGEHHIYFSLNSSMHPSSGAIIMHLMPTLYLRIASADSTITQSLVCVVHEWRAGLVDEQK